MTLLKVQGLNVSYKTMKGELKAVQGVDFELEQEETLGIVGESACGKSTLGLALLNLVPPPGRVTHGRILLEGEDILSLDNERLRRTRGKVVSMIFQDPMTSLNPVKKIGDHFVEYIRAHDNNVSVQGARSTAKTVLEDLGISPDRMADYP